MCASARLTLPLEPANVRIALAQINTTVGAVAANTARILAAAEEARNQGADLVVFPELAITGYPPRDLVEHPSLIQANLSALEELAEASNADGFPGMIVGYIEPRIGDDGKQLYNAAALIDGGSIVSRHFKSLLPTYDVFDEGRHFQPAPSVRLADFRGHWLAITICEDVWNDRTFWNKRQYPNDPVEKLIALHPDLLINISASPFSLGKPAIRAGMFGTAAERHAIPTVFVNQVGGNDSLVFDGRSGVWGVNGKPAFQCEPFKEQILTVDVPLDLTGEDADAPMADPEDIYLALTTGLRDYVGKCGFKRVLIGLSGGIDSALTAAIAADALGPENVVGVAMPSQFSSDHSVSDAEALAKNLGIEFHQIAIEPVFNGFMGQLGEMFAGTAFGVAEENLQARIRGVLLMTLSNKFGWMVLTTGNKSELATGYCTLYGDMSGGLAILSDVLKTRVYDVSRWINRDGERIPNNTIEKPPSAELRPDQLDTDSLPPYEELDPIIAAYVEDHLSRKDIVRKGHDAALVQRIIGMIDRNEYKRQQAPPGIKITGKAFGFGRRMPIARGSWES